MLPKSVPRALLPAFATAIVVALASSTPPSLAAKPGASPPGETAKATLPAGHPVSSSGLPAGHPPAGGAGGAGASGLTGTVLETMDAGGYTYMKLKTAEGEIWAAVRQSKVATGSTVTIVNSMPMDGFESKSLNREFDRIVFGGLATPPSADGATPEIRAAMAARHAVAATGPEAAGKISVPKAEGAEGRTVAELFARRAELKGKSVVVRGQVVKFNARIMGRNWIHLRDGTGTRETKDDDLTVTTSESAAVGDVVLVEGVVAVDRDFGSGYRYALLVEDAKLGK